jgi:hypothetical protein
MSADVGDAVLDFRLGSGLGLSGKREDSCLLPFTKPRQQHDLAIGKLERVMMDVRHALVDLAKDRKGMVGVGTSSRVFYAQPLTRPLSIVPRRDNQGTEAAGGVASRRTTRRVTGWCCETWRRTS